MDTIRWQKYIRKKTGETILFRRTKSGAYLREDGKRMPLGSLRRFYKWVCPNPAARAQLWEVNPATGFKVRVKKVPVV